jgi:catechol 2,3-dioxygenase-like lactoylglutathione lyase family enzyme
MIKYHSVVLFVKDIGKAKHFYCNLLSIPVEIDMGKNVILKSGITLWEIDENNIIVKSIGKEEIISGNRSELYFETDNMAGIEQIIKENNIKKLHDTHEEPWGQRTIRFYDYDSNIIEVGERLNTFLNRLVESGLSKEELHRKTGMKIEDIEKSIGHKI